jgi:hypothetical protein
MNTLKNTSRKGKNIENIKLLFFSIAKMETPYHI